MAKKTNTKKTKTAKAPKVKKETLPQLIERFNETKLETAILEKNKIFIIGTSIPDTKIKASGVMSMLLKEKSGVVGEHQVFSKAKGKTELEARLK